MNRVLIATQKKNEYNWLQNELLDFGRIVRNINSLDILIPTCELVEAEIVVILDSVVYDDRQLLANVIQLIAKLPKTIIMFIHARESDGFELLAELKERHVICIPFIDLEPGMVEKILRKEVGEERGDLPQELLDASIYEDKPNEVVDEVPDGQIGKVDEEPDSEKQIQSDVISVKAADSVDQKHEDDNRNNSDGIVKEEKLKRVEYESVSTPVAYHVTRKLILVGCCDRANGSSFVCRNLVHVAGKAGIPTALIELPFHQPYHFDRSLMSPGILQSMTEDEEDKFQRDFVNIPYLITTGESIEGDPYIKEGVQYIVPHPDYKITNWTEAYTRKLYSLTKNIALTVVDIGVQWLNPTLSVLLDEADEFLIVQQAEPARLERLFNPRYIPAKNLDFVLDQKNVSVLINQYYQYPKKEFYLEYFNAPSIQQHYFIPSVDPSIMSSCALNGHYEAKHSEELYSIFHSLISRWIPYGQPKQKPSLVKKFKQIFQGG